MPNLNAIDNIGDKAERQLQALLVASVETALDQIEQELPPDIRSSYHTETRKIILASIQTSTQLGLQEEYLIRDVDAFNKYYLNTNYKAGTLSKRLWKDAQRAQRAVETTVKQHIENRTTWVKLTQDIRRVSFRKDELPQYIKDIELAFKRSGQTGLKTALKKAERNIERFSTEEGITRSNLQRAYSDVVKAARNGDLAVLEEKLSVALEKKAINNSENLARTEISRAYQDATMRRMQDDPDVIGWRWQLSPSHPRPDQCNTYAEWNAFGRGEGVYPVNEGPPFPAHNRCLCMIEEVLVGEAPESGRFSHERGREYFTSLKKGTEEDREKLKSMVGVKGMRNMNEWQKNLKGWNGVQKQTPLPKDLVVKKD